jgi:hypothetical protein
MSMWDFIVLGQIPGTQIQVTFNIWLTLTGGIASGIIFYMVGRCLQSNHLVAVLRIKRILQTAAYSQWLITRRHIQA